MAQDQQASMRDRFDDPRHSDLFEAALRAVERRKRRDRASLDTAAAIQALYERNRTALDALPDG